MMRVAMVTLFVGLLVAACGDGDPALDDDTIEPYTMDDGFGAQLYPDVVDVEVNRTSDGTYRFDVTLSSPYDTPERYADAWRVKGPDGEVYGIRELLHDHASEQPFTRSLDGVEIPEDVETVTVQGRDLENGWGGETLDISVP